MAFSVGQRMQMQRSCRARTTTPPPRILHSPAHLSQAWTPIFSASCLMLWRSWVWNGLPQRNRPIDAWKWMNGSCQGAVRPLNKELRHSSQRSTMRSPNLGMHLNTRGFLRSGPPATGLALSSSYPIDQEDTRGIGSSTILGRGPWRFGGWHLAEHE